MILRIENLSKHYQKQTALSGVSMNIPQGSIYGILGPNGAGKTTLIRMLTRITEPDSGSISFMGEPLSDRHLSQMGYLPEERGLYRKMRVKDQLLFFAELKGLKPQQARQQLKYWIDRFEIKGWLDKRVEELSKGMQQKVQFIATVLHEPKLLILDEPFSGFDPVNANLVMEEIRTLKKKGTTILFSTHRMDSVELLCDELALINRAEKILDGSLTSIRNQFRMDQYEIIYSGELMNDDSLIRIVKHEPNAEGNVAILETNIKIKSNEVLQHLIQQGIQLHSFREKLPGMDEIFIRAVQEHAQKNNA